MPILHSYYQDVYRCPIVRLDGYSAQHGLSTGILAYLDFGGATGSSKDGLAETMLAFATERGTLQPGMPVVEASSGSFGAALAVSCATTGHPCILVVPSNLPIAQRKRLQDLGAHIIACSSSGRRAMERVAEDTAKRYGGYYTHYFSNDDNPEYHRRVTGPQIYKNAGDAIDAIVIGVGSGGTITGVAEGATRTVIGGVRYAVTVHAHAYTATVTTAATCTTPGVRTYACACGESYTEAIPATGHSYVRTEENGNYVYTCSVCGDSYVDSIVPATGHSYEAVVTAPTCDKMGYTTYTCSACGDSYVADYVDAAGHDCETETVPATCLGYGFVRESCKHCDYSVITEITAPLGHDYQAVVTAPTLDEGGYTTHTCSRCGDSYVDSETPALGHKCAAYTDIPTDWAKEGICFVIENGLMVGTTSTTFAPKDTLTRAMLVTVLYRMAGSPAVDAPSGFTDVADGQWYSDAIAWAAANGIVNGVGGNKFAPSEPVTREQLAAIFFRYAKAEAPEADVLSGYPDAESVSTYARDAMAWAVSTGLVTGSKEADGTYLAPQGLAAREQAAAILMRYVKANA